jgi:hypothetical protein
MFAHTGRASATDLSHWLGPLSPAFAAMAAGSAENSAEKPAAAPDQPVTPAEPPGGPDTGELRALFHSLNNQLGVILTYAELLEAKAADDGTRSRAAQIVSATIEALETSKKIRGSVVRP